MLAHALSCPPPVPWLTDPFHSNWTEASKPSIFTGLCESESPRWVVLPQNRRVQSVLRTPSPQLLHGLHQQQPLHIPHPGLRAPHQGAARIQREPDQRVQVRAAPSLPRPAPHQGDTQAGTELTELCHRYRDYRSADDYTYTVQFWHIFAARLAFLILFEVSTQGGAGESWQRGWIRAGSP